MKTNRSSLKSKISRKAYRDGYKNGLSRSSPDLSDYKYNRSQGFENKGTVTGSFYFGQAAACKHQLIKNHADFGYFDKKGGK